jgi:hypothetical protein
MLRVSGLSSGPSIVVAQIVLTHPCAIGCSASAGMRCSCTWMRKPATRMRCSSGAASATRMRCCSGAATATRMRWRLVAASRFLFTRRGELWPDQHQRNTNTNECSHELHLRFGIPSETLTCWQAKFGFHSDFFLESCNCS